LDLNEVYNLHFFIESKERGSFQTYAELDRIYNLGQIDLLNEYIDEYALTGKVNVAIEIFKKQFSFTTAADGTATLPTDWQMPLFGYTTASNGEMRFYNESEWISAINSQLRPATATRPAARIATDKVQLFPKQAIPCVIEYLRTPAKPNFVYTQTGRAINYNQAGSTQLEWSTLEIPKLILKALSYLGINLREQDITTYAESKNKETV
jgi:hypothetical protein